MDPTPSPTKKAYLPNFPFCTHTPVPNWTTDPIFNTEYNTWYWITPPDTHHPINKIPKSINPFRNLFAELIVHGKVFWNGQTYSIRDPHGFWETCRRHNIHPRFPPTPIFTAPTADPNCFRAVAEYYNLFAAYNELTNPEPWKPYLYPTPLRPLKTNFQFPLTAKPYYLSKRPYYPECSDTSTSEDPQEVKPRAKRLKTPREEDP